MLPSNIMSNPPLPIFEGATLETSDKENFPLDIGDINISDNLDDIQALDFFHDSEGNPAL